MATSTPHNKLNNAAKIPSFDELEKGVESFGTYWKTYIDAHLPPLSADTSRAMESNGNTLTDRNHNHNHNHMHAQRDHMSPSECVKCQTSHKRIIMLETQNADLQLKYEQMKIEKDHLLICVRGLAQLLKEGRKPEKGLIPMMKDPNCAWSKAVDNIKQKIRKQIKKLFPSQELLIDIEQSQIEQDNDWITDEALSNRIQHYIKLNDLNTTQTKQNPLIVLKPNTIKKRSSRSKNKNRNNHTSVIKDTFDLSASAVRQLHRRDLMERHKLPHGYRVENLVGQFGVRAKCKIPRGTVLGQYTGTQYLEEEYERLFHGTTEKTVRDIYGFDTFIYEPLEDLTEDEDDDHDMRDESKYSEYYTKMCKKRVVTLDGYDDRDCNVMMYINDCRANIVDDSEPTKEDEKYWNCSYRTVMVNGDPAVFIIARKDIEAGEDLNVFYGPGYGRQIIELDNHEQVMAKMQGLVNNTVLKIVGWSEGVPEVYTLV